MDEEAVFQVARSINSVDARRAYLDQICGQDESLRASVEALLESHDQAGSFLEQPAPELAQTMNVSHEALDAGLAASFGSEAAVVVGGAGHSVLKSLGGQLPAVPKVTLRDGPDEEGDVVKLGSEELPADQDGGRYQLLGEIARGGMGAIIKGRDTDLGRDLAIKVLLDAHKDKPDVMQRFVEEAQIGGQLQHPGIAPVYELGQFGDQRPFFTMKLVKGETLASLLTMREDPRDDWPRLLGIFEQVCQTMAYAHSRGVIHRDLKPANVMVGAFGEVQVMDWGVSKVLRAGGIHDEQKSLGKQRDISVVETRRSTGSDFPGGVGSQTQMGSVMGTPAYMPPEQALGEVDRLDERADVFGLGAILCEILTGKPPYVGKDGTEAFRMASRGKLDDCFARLDASDAEQELIELSKKALSDEPDDRFRNASEMSTGITKHLEGVQERLKEAELARVEAQTRSEEERRRKKLYLAIAGMTLLLAIGGVGIVQQQAQMKQAETTARLRANFANMTHQAAASRELLEDRPILSLLLAAEAVEGSLESGGLALPIAHQALLNATQTWTGQLLSGHDSSMRDTDIGSKWLVTRDSTGATRLWDLTAQKPALSSKVLADETEFTASSEDGHWLVTGGLSKLQRWDLTAPSADLSPLVVAEGLGDIARMVMSPDGRRLVASFKDDAVDTIRVWDLHDADSMVSRVVGTGELLHSEIGLSADGRWVAAREEGVVKLWDLHAEDSDSSLRLLEGHSDTMGPIRFSRDSRWLVIASGKDGAAKIWDLEAENIDASVRVVEATRIGDLNGMVITSDSRWLIIAEGHLRQRIRRWDLSSVQSGTTPFMLQGHTDQVNSLATSDDGRWLVSGSADRTVRVWDMNADDPAVSAIVLKSHDASVTSVGIGPRGRWVAAGAKDGSLRLWDLHAFNSPWSSLAIRKEVLQEVDHFKWRAAVSSNGRLIAGQTRDNVVRLWDFEAKDPAAFSRVLPGPSEPIRAVEISSDDRWLIASSSGTIRVWDLKSPDIPSSSRDWQTESIAIDPTRRWLATGHVEQHIRLWDLTADDLYASSRILNCTGSPHLISPDGRWLVTASNVVPDGISDYTVRLWDLAAEDLGASSRVLDGHKTRTSLMAVDADSRWLAIQNGREVWLWNLKAEEPSKSPRKIRAPDGGMSLSNAFGLSPNGRWLFTARHNTRTAELWDLSMSDPVPRGLRGHNGVGAVAFSPDGNWMVTGSPKKVQLWDLTSTRPWTTARVLRHDWPWGLGISADGLWLVTNDDGMIRRWPLKLESLLDRARKMAGRELTAEERRQYQVESEPAGPAVAEAPPPSPTPPSS